MWENICCYRKFILLLQQPYQKGDNDFYWFHVKNTKIFYVVSELKLIKGGIIATDEQKGRKKFNLTEAKLWLQDYEFNYDTINEHDNKNKLLNMFAKKENVQLPNNIMCAVNDFEDEKPIKRKNI